MMVIASIRRINRLVCVWVDLPDARLLTKVAVADAMLQQCCIGDCVASDIELCVSGHPNTLNMEVWYKIPRVLSHAL